MANVYDDYSPARFGWFFGLNGWQLFAVLACGMPIFVLISRQDWLLLPPMLGVFALVCLLVLVPVRGRSATGWLLAMARFAVGSLLGWTRFRSKAATGQASDDLSRADLPGVLSGLEIHEGPPQPPSMARVAMIQDRSCRTWAVTAAVSHPGIGMAAGPERDRQGRGLAELIDVCASTELVSELMILVRTVPDDGAERDLWLARHRAPDSPALARRVNSDLADGLSRAAVRTEQFVTLVVPELRLARPAREFGGGLEGRGRVLYGLMGEVEAQLRGGLGMTAVSWLTSPQLAAAVRTGFAPGDRAGIVDALALTTRDPQVCTDVPWALAGPSGADLDIRHYSHDAWNSITATLKLPTRGAALGALAPVLTPSEPGERRSFVVVYPIMTSRAANRQTSNSEFAADVGDSLRTKTGITMRARERRQAAKTRRLDTKLDSGHALIHPYAIAAVTAPKTARIAEYGRRLDAAIRRAGYAPLRLDLAQDAGFAASTLPVGISLNRKLD